MKDGRCIRALCGLARFRSRATRRSLAGLAVRWYPHCSRERRRRQGWRRPARRYQESPGPRLADRGRPPQGSVRVQRSPGGRLPPLRLVAAIGRGSHLAPAGGGVSSRSRALRAGSWLYFRSNSQASDCESGARISPVGASRWADLSQKFNTSRQDLRPMPIENVNCFFRKSPARRWGLGSCPSGQQGPSGAWGGSASRWCAPVGSVASRHTALQATAQLPQRTLLDLPHALNGDPQRTAEPAVGPLPRTASRLCGRSREGDRRRRVFLRIV